MKKRLFDDPNPKLWKEAEEAEEHNQKFITKAGCARVRYLSKKLFSLRPQKGKPKDTDQEYYKLLENLISLCQKGFLGFGLSYKDYEWVNEGLECLLSLYEPMIGRISRNFTSDRRGYDEIKSYAQQLFIRLTLGDTPWAIKEFMDDQKDPTQETKAALSNIGAAKIKEKTRLQLDCLINSLIRQELHPDDIRLARNLFDEELQHFGEWINQPILEFPQKESSYRDEKYKQYRGGNFTVFMEEYLPKRLQDLYRRKELKDGGETSLEIPLSEEIEDNENLSVRSDLVDEIHSDQQITKLKKILSPGENKVFQYRLKGYKPTEIAKELGISKGRVSQIMKAIQKKYKVLPEN